MPTYEYACPKCGIFEHFQSIKSAALERCPTCKKAKVTRLVSGGGGVIFKGTGFWETDYNRSKDYASKSKSEDGKAEAKTDTPDSKPKAQPKMQKSDAPASGTATATAPPPTKTSK